MPDLREKQLLHRALARGLLERADVVEITRLLDAPGPDGRRPSLEAIFAAMRLPAEILDDRALVGRRFGNFEIVDVLGHGGMGSVYLARQTGLGRLVALKLFDVRHALKDSEVERFRREARAACRLEHPHVIQAIDFGEEGPFLYFAMEYAAGGTAEARLARSGPLEERAVLGIIAAIADALAYAASKGILHRDVKPANILFAADGTPKLGDLGLALDQASARLTEKNVTVGTAAYVSPEQAMAGTLDSRTDVYSLGIAAYELLTGKVPFFDPDPFLILAKQVNARLPDVRAERPEVSPATAALLERMTQKRAAERLYPEQARDDARGILSGRIQSWPRPSQEGAARAPAIGEGPRGRRLPRAAMLAAGALAAVAAGTAALALLPGRRAARVDPATEARATEALAVALLARRGPDGGIGEVAGEPTDPWVSAQAVEALVLLDDPARAPALSRMLERIAALRLADGGFPYVVGIDNTSCLEATAAVARAAALAKGRLAYDARPLLRSLFDWLLLAQAEDGSWATLPILGPEGAMTSATADALTALAMAARALGEEKHAAVAARRGAGRLASFYDRERGFFVPNPRRAARGQRAVAGLDEVATLALLDARALARAAGAEESAAAREVLAAIAARGPPADPPVDEVGQVPVEEYRFRSLPEHLRSSANEFVWLVFTQRLLVAERLAAEGRTAGSGGGAGGERWAEAARRLRARIPELPARLRDEPVTWRLAEALLAPAVLRAGGPGLIDLVR